MGLPRVENKPLRALDPPGETPPGDGARLPPGRLALAKRQCERAVISFPGGLA